MAIWRAASTRSEVTKWCHIISKSRVLNLMFTKDIWSGCDGNMMIEKGLSVTFTDKPVNCYIVSGFL